MAKGDRVEVVQEPDQVTACFGEEKITGTVEYQSFCIGPFFYKTTVKAGETPEEAGKRAVDFVTNLARNSYVAKRDMFLDHVADARMTAKSRGLVR